MKLYQLLMRGVLIGTLVQTSYAGFIPKPPIRCEVGSFDSKNVQLKCGAGFKKRRQMNRDYFQRVYGDPAEGKIVEIDLNNTASANQLKSY